MKERLCYILQRAVAPGAQSRILRRLTPRSGLALDVGCGTTSWLWNIGMNPYGVDVSPGSVRAFGRAAVASATALPFRDGCFDSVWSFGLLHHLPDRDARAALGEMRRVTRPGGVTTVVDAVLPRSGWRRPLAWLLRRMDRGRSMRSRKELEALFDSPGSWRRERITYSYTGLEAVFSTYAGR